MAPIFEEGDRVSLVSGQVARVVGLTDLFSRTYADVFIESDGPLQRVEVSQLSLLANPASALTEGQTLPAPRFVARLAAQHLRALLTRQGVISAANFRLTPLPHQILAVNFVLNRPRPRAMLADEVGLGKTIEAALVYEEFKLRGLARRVLVVAPAGLTHQWRDEFSLKFGETFAVYDRGLMDALRELHGQETNLWTVHDRVVTSLDFVKPYRLRADLDARERERRETANRRLFEDVVAAEWDMVIFDEAHKLSKHADGSETARYRVGEALARSVPMFLLLTATPHQGDPARFMHLLNLVDPYAFNQVQDLRPKQVGTVVWRTRKRATVDADGNRLFKQRITDIYPVDRSGPAHALERELYEQVSDYVRDNYNKALGRDDRAFGFLMILFQRMVTSSTQAIFESLQKRLMRLRELEAWHAHQVHPDFDEQAAADDDTQRVSEELASVAGVVDEVELAKELAAVQSLLDLARRARLHHDAKMVALLEIIDEVCRREGNPSTKFLIFTEFVATQTALKELLEGMGYRVVLINGSQSMDARIAARQAFAADAQFLVSTDAGGEGINLQFCHVMVNYDLPWNPMKLEQRIGRLDRIGQTHNVLVLNLLVANSVEKRVREILENKLALIRRQYGEDKLADILSTLQDEFHFDRLYMDAVRLREAEAGKLEAVAQQIYERAQEILEKDDLLLPQAQAQQETAEAHVVEVSQSKIKAMLAGHLSQFGMALNEYSRRPGVYYFDVPDRDGGRTRYSDVVFDREQAVADDSLTYLHLNHPVIQRVLKDLTQDRQPAVAHLHVRARPQTSQGKSTPIDGPCLWAVHRLRMTNYTDVDLQDLISVCVDPQGQSHPRLAQKLLDATPDELETAFIPTGSVDIDAMQSQARQLAETKAEDLFGETLLAHMEDLNREREKVERYYEQLESAVDGIAIENIRQAKHRDLLARRREDLAAIDRGMTLVPELEVVGMALVTEG
jgi:SNF2 family DNA or RNA helicase